MCNVIGCKKVATETWALVPVCNEHRTDIASEFEKYYARNIPASGRVIYQLIEHLTPWWESAKRKHEKSANEKTV